jgi:hypothetical protein
VRTLKWLRQPGANTHDAPDTKIGATDFRLKPDVARADTLSPRPETNSRDIQDFPQADLKRMQIHSAVRQLERSTLADWVGSTSQLLTPLDDALRRYVMAVGKLHADDTPVPVLAPRNGQTKT